MSERSPAEVLAAKSQEEQAAFIANLSEAEADALLYAWRGFRARPSQLAPDGGWVTWLALAGRGWGKTEAGAQWIKERVASGARSIALIAETQKDLEEVMVARLLSIYPSDEAPTARFKPVRIRWPNGATALGYNGNEPDQLRGPEFDTAWVDELAKYRYAKETWDMLQFTMRAGKDPRVMVTTTPRPIAVIRDLVERANKGDGVVITRGSTMDNAANLAPPFLAEVKRRYEGTRLGRQELFGDILSDVPGALWTLDSIGEARVDAAPQLKRVVVSVDPSGQGEDGIGDTIGIVVAGVGFDGIGYPLADWSCDLPPSGWGRRAVEAYHHFGADRLIAEKNFGGAMVGHVIKTVDRNVAYKEVTASRGKVARAEPISALYDQGRIKHVGVHRELEDQMCAFTSNGYLGKDSPDRVDALVWAMTELMLGDQFSHGFS